MSYPSTIANITNPNPTDKLNNPSHSSIETAQNTNISQIQTFVGTLSSAVGTLVYDIRSSNSDGGGHIQSANKGGTGQTSYAKGDMLVAQSQSVLSKLAVGVDGYVLTADSSQQTGVRWAATGGGGVGYFNLSDGSDGELSLTTPSIISLSSVRYFEKNYTTINITDAGALSFTSPRNEGTVVVLKATGNINITSSMPAAIDVTGMGALGGASITLSTSNGNDAFTQVISGLNEIVTSVVLLNGIGGSAATSGGTVGGTGNRGGSSVLFRFFNPTDNAIGGATGTGIVYPLPAGGGGSGGGTGTGNNATNGSGGRGGGALVLVCGGTLNLGNGVTIKANGENGQPGGNGSVVGGTRAAGGMGGGGGGGGGLIMVYYNTLGSNNAVFQTYGGNGGPGGSAVFLASNAGVTNIAGGGGGGGGGHFRYFAGGFGGNGFSGGSIASQNNGFAGSVGAGLYGGLGGAGGAGAASVAGGGGGGGGGASGSSVFVRL